MQPLKSLHASRYQDLIDYDVVDQKGDHVGSLHSLWSDQTTGDLEFVGVKTGWLFGKNHVVPSERVDVEPEDKFIQIHFAAEFIKEAPAVAADEEISEEQEEEIYRYFGLDEERGAETTIVVSGTGGASSGVGPVMAPSAVGDLEGQGIPKTPDGRA